MASMAVSTVVGPVEQLTPMAPAPHSVSSAAACWARRRRGSCRLSSTVTMTSTGRSGAISWAASSASRASFSAGMVSMMSMSTPACSKSPNLLGKGRAGLVEAGLAQRLEANTERADRAGDPGLAGLLVFEVLDGLAGDADAGRC